VDVRGEFRIKGKHVEEPETYFHALEQDDFNDFPGFRGIHAELQPPPLAVKVAISTTEAKDTPSYEKSPSSRTPAKRGYIEPSREHLFTTQ